MRILIGYDGSENSDFALEDLKRAGLPPIAEALVLTAADVYLAPAITDPDEVFPKVVPHSVQVAHEYAMGKLKDAESMASRACEVVKTSFPSWSVQYAAVASSPAWALIGKAEEFEADLIVMGAVGRSLLGGRLILGSVSQRVLYETSTSVRISRTTGTRTEGPLRLLVGVDHSSYSSAVIDSLCDRNWPPDTQVRLVAVVDTVIPIEDPADPSTIEFVEVGDASDWDKIRQIFKPEVDRLLASGLDAAVMIVRGKPKVALINEAASWDADCVFVGAKGITGVGRLLLGSVASAVSTRAHCSVEVVRPKKLK